MKQEEYARRQSRAARETLVIAEVEDGFRVYSPDEPSNVYVVSGGVEEPHCTCPDFRFHEADPEWRCKHILAVFDQVEPAIARAEAEVQKPEQSRGGRSRPPRTTTAPVAANGPSQMVIKRSVSPDGRIDSLSVEFACPVEELADKDIKSRAVKALTLQSEIIEGFLTTNGKSAPTSSRGDREVPPNGPDRPPNGAVSAELVSIGGMDTRWGRRLFINVQANGERIRLFGSRRQLAEALIAAGASHLTDRVSEGVELHVPCRVTTKPSEDGRYTNVDQVLPARSGERARR